MLGTGVRGHGKRRGASGHSQPVLPKDQQGDDSRTLEIYQCLLRVFFFLCPLNTFSLSPMQKDHQKNHTMSMLGLQKADLKKAKIKADVLLCRCTFLPPVCLSPDQER